MVYAADDKIAGLNKIMKSPPQVGGFFFIVRFGICDYSMVGWDLLGWGSYRPAMPPASILVLLRIVTPEMSYILRKISVDWIIQRGCFVPDGTMV